ncbi:MAG: hypothetical protein DI581_11830 [Staphylococcus capitis]|nr:MAG: hypothetical protein DI581_11830 [Staphylococcus capitis]
MAGVPVVPPSGFPARSWAGSADSGAAASERARAVPGGVRAVSGADGAEAAAARAGPGRSAGRAWSVGRGAPASSADVRAKRDRRRTAVV